MIPTASIRAYIENIIYHNEGNYYTVLEASDGGKLFTVTGHFPYICEGETIEAEGDFISHPVYGRQFAAVSYKTMAPESTDAIERYLAAGALKGIGPALAKRIVKKFGEDTFHIIEDDPDALASVKGISRTMALRISEDARALSGMREAMMFMQGYGISPVMSTRIYERYGPALYTILRDNPYRLAEDIDGIGFRTADTIAMRMGIEPGDRFRIRCGILYCLAEAAKDGHTWLSMNALRHAGSELLDIDLGDIEPVLIELQISGKIVIIERKGEGADPELQDCGSPEGLIYMPSGVDREDPSAAYPGQYGAGPGGEQGGMDPSSDDAGAGEAPEIQVYLSAYYYTEKGIAQMLKGIAVRGRQERSRTEQRLRSIEEDIGMELDELQREAVTESVENGLLVITGGPGTGKTTTINALIKYYSMDHDCIMLAAPTGRAAKRMSEATGCEAKTIHRLLEYTGVPSEGNAPGRPGSSEGTDGGLGAAPYAGSGNAKGAGATDGKGRFLRDEKDPLEADVLIIDEMSMVDIFLMNALLKAVVPGTRLILVGDADQLPSVGAGNVLKDIIDSGAFRTVRLSHIFRQAALSDIVTNAHLINSGKKVDLSRKSRDFLFIRSRDPEKTITSIETLMTRKLPGYVGCGALEIQVLTATRKGRLGVENLNKRLQEYLNPPSADKAEKQAGDILFREGDKVMQTRNNYDLEWTRYDESGLAAESGSGVFNGDIGRVAKIDKAADELTVMFDDMRKASYDRKQLADLELAYAVTVHKSQGSEYPAVIMPMFRGPGLLMNRNLLYTAVTRARRCIVMVGLPEVFAMMAENVSENRRCTGLKDRIEEEMGSAV